VIQSFGNVCGKELVVKWCRDVVLMVDAARNKQPQTKKCVIPGKHMLDPGSSLLKQPAISETNPTRLHTVSSRASAYLTRDPVF